MSISPSIDRSSATVTSFTVEAKRIKTAIATRQYTSSSEVIRDALREWELAQARREHQLVELRKDIAKGHADIEAGRVTAPRRARHRSQGRGTIGRTKKIPLLVTDEATADLAEIWAFIADDNREQSDRFIGELEQKFNRLTKFPELGKRREQLAAGLRGLSHGRYTIYYLPTATELIIVRVRHPARDAAAIFDDG